MEARQGTLLSEVSAAPRFRRSKRENHLEVTEITVTNAGSHDQDGSSKAGERPDAESILGSTSGIYWWIGCDTREIRQRQ